MPDAASTAPPDWLPAAQAQLDLLTGQHADKKRATVIALVTARLTQQPEYTVWDRATHPNVCSKTVYDTKWKKDPIFAGVLAAVEKMARTWRDEETLRALHTAARKLALATPAIAEQLVSIATTGRVRRVRQDANGKLLVYYADAAAQDILRAGLGVMDRAGIETAQKGSTNLSGEVKTETLTDDERAARLAAIMAAAAARREQAEGT